MPDKSAPTALSIVVFDGHYDKVHYALAMAAAAAALDRPTTLFFTMDACRALMVESSGAHAWRDIPATTGDTGATLDARFIDEKIADFEDLLASCIEMKVDIMVCEMGLKARKLSAATLRPDIGVAPGGLVTFLSGPAKDGQLVFI